MDIAKYSSDSRAVIKVAREVAAEFRHPEISIEHLLVAVVRHEGSEVESILNQLKKNPATVAAMVESYLKQQPSRAAARDSLSASPAVQAVLAQAFEEKGKLYDALVEPEHILLAIFDRASALPPYLREQLEFTKEDLYQAMAESRSVEAIAVSPPRGEGSAAPAEEPRTVAAVSRYCADLTGRAAAGEYDPMIGRAEELRQVIQILLRRRKNSPVLVGGAGVGKSAIVEGLAQAVVSGAVPKALQGVKVLEVDMGGLVAGAKYKGEFEERFKALIGEVIKSAGRLILFIDEVHTIMGAGSGGAGMDAANLLKPALARGQLRLVGATTEEEYTKHLEKDKALLRRFEKVKVGEPPFDEAVAIVNGVAAKYEEHHRVTFSPEARVAAVKYAKRYLSEKNLPDIALDIIDEAASEFGVKKEMAERLLPGLEAAMKDIEPLLAAADGAGLSDGDQQKLRALYETFAGQLDALGGYWGHRLEVPEVSG
ncbi:MAG TPA: AAA family ATPase [candidate division Zixibacteria bacterium]|nr:AAA family ATPase [candidate division Zixibacteria bacterium]